MEVEGQSPADEWLEDPANLRDRITEPGNRFCCDYAGYMTFVDTVFDIAKTADESVRGLKALVSTFSSPGSKPEDPATQGRAEVTEKSPGTPKLMLEAYGSLIAEMLWCRGVDNFLTYLAELLGLIFTTKPDTLRSNKTVTMETVLGFRSMDELVKHLAEKRVYDLSFRGMREMRTELEKELGFDLFPVGDRLDRAVLIIESRNLICHNRSVVNELFIRKTRATWTTVGAKDQVGLVCAQRCMRFLAHAVLDIDERAVDKFGLPVKPVADKCKGCVKSANDAVPALPRCRGDAAGSASEEAPGSARE